MKFMKRMGEFFRKKKKVVEKPATEDKEIIDYDDSKQVDQLFTDIISYNSYQATERLHDAIKRAYPELLISLVPKLMVQGADINAPDKEGKTPLENFVDRIENRPLNKQKPYTKVIVDLVDRGANLKESTLIAARDKMKNPVAQELEGAPFKDLKKRLEKVKGKLDRKIIKNNINFVKRLKWKLMGNDKSPARSKEKYKKLTERSKAIGDSIKKAAKSGRGR